VIAKTPRSKHIHPFPARMAPEIAIHALEKLNPGDIILDPMAGSGTVLHEASLMGFTPIGFDLDPLAVLMTKVSTGGVNPLILSNLLEKVLFSTEKVKLENIRLTWIDDDKETIDFINFWFAKKQIDDLRKISFILSEYDTSYVNSLEVDALRIALSRIIITKKIGASLAWDISHSRPHKVKETNDYDVILGFEKSARAILKIFSAQKVLVKGSIEMGDARHLNLIPDKYVDAVITSPPYLNAIDYMRGSKFSLIWLGYSLSSLRVIRSNSIGAEKKLNVTTGAIEKIYNNVFGENQLEKKYASMIRRYIGDSLQLMSEISRVLKTNRLATIVIGNSTLKGVYIDNSKVFEYAGEVYGLSLTDVKKREIPLNMRYLPVPSNNLNSLSKRMKHEVILTFTNRPILTHQ